jgi:hypothetical protein
MLNDSILRAQLNCSNRLSRSDNTFTPSSASEQLARNPYIAPEDLMQYMVDEDDEMSLFAVSDLILYMWPG